MKRNVLLVFNRNKESLAEVVQEVFDERVFIDGLNGLIDQETNLVKANKRLKLRQYNLLIVDLHVPADSKDASNADDRMGLEWIKALHAEGSSLPSIIVTTSPDEVLSYKASRLPDCRILSLGEHFSDLLAEMSADALRGRNTKRGIYLELHISLTDNTRKPYFDIIGTIDGQDIKRNGVLEIDNEIIQELRDRCCQNIPNLPKEHWEAELKRIGTNLFRELFDKNRILINQLYRLMDKIDPEKQFQFRFEAGKTVHPVAFEALFENEKDFFWMLKYPICRQLPISGDYHELSIGRSDRRQRINCLIINSDVHEYVEELGKTFSELLNIQKESAFLESFLTEDRQALKIGTVRRIDGPHNGVPFSETIRQVLNEEKFHLVHYAGHSYYDAENSKGYLVLPGNDYPEVLDIEEFSAWLRKSQTQFVFLSSCHSSEEDFVYELASKEIPAILGFRWDLDDEMAYKYAKSFYQKLFKGKNRLEYALLEARKEMYADHRQNRIWAAPMLVLQTSNR